MEVTPRLEDPDDILAYLSTAIRVVHDALDHGVSLADSKLSDLPPDAHLWANFVRYGACLYLKKAPQGEWRLGRRLRNCGIEICRDPLVVRVLKAQGANPPHPGFSGARQMYFCQKNPSLPLEFCGVAMPEIANFILDWSVSDTRELALALSKPVGLWKYQERPTLEWRRLVDLPDGEPLRFSPGEDEDVPVEFDIDELEADGEVG